jgi:hypothetical protein
MIKKSFFFVFFVASIIFAQSEVDTNVQNDQMQSEDQMRMQHEQMMQEQQQMDSVEEPAVEETERPDTQQKIVLTPVKENQTEVITTYSGEENILKSPKKAFFLSLLLPGLGEYYAKASIPRIAIPAGVEVATYISSAIFSMKYREKTDLYKKFADENYSHDRFNTWYKYVTNESTTNVVIKTTAHDSAYFGVDQNNKTNDYYEMIGKYDMFTQGWKDVNPILDSIYYRDQNPQSVMTELKAMAGDTARYWSAFALDSSNNFENAYIKDQVSGKIINAKFMWMKDDSRPFYYGKSANQLYYMTLRNDANEMADVSRSILFTLIVNRLVSAVDAALAATSYNRKITGGSLTYYQKIRLEPIQVGNTMLPANGVVASYTF